MIVAFLLALAAAPVEPAAFEPGIESFADAPACTAHLTKLAEEARQGGYDAVEGPYDIAAGDVRIHTVKAEGDGHRIHEYRCLDKAFSSRSWRHSMAAAEQPFTIESAARNAEWLKKDAPQQ